MIWNTTEVPTCHNYTIVATAAIEAPDNNPADNTLVDGTVKIRILGDTNGDNKIDIKDVAAISGGYGEFIGRPRWNPDLDINGDGKIDVKDVAITTAAFGKVCT